MSNSKNPFVKVVAAGLSPQRHLLGLALGLLLVCGVPAANAQLPSLPMPPPPPTVSQRLVGDLAYRVMREAGTDGKGRTYRIEVSTSQGVSGGLGPLLADALAGALVQRGWAADRRADQRDAIEPVGYVFELELSLRPPRLLAALRVRELPRDVWQTMRAPEGAMLIATHAETPLDAELRVLLGKPLAKASLKRARLRHVPMIAGKGITSPPQGPPLDMWVGDLSGDRVPSLALLFADKVVLYQARSGRNITGIAEFALGGLPPNPAKLRQPLGRLVSVVGHKGEVTLVVAVSDFAHAVGLGLTDNGLRRESTVHPSIGWPLYALGVNELVAAAWPRGRDVLSGRAHRVRLDGTQRRRAGPLIPVHEVRGFAHSAAVEPRHRPFLVASVAGGGVGMRNKTGAFALGRHGLAAVVGDFDVDGAAEVLLTGGGLGKRTDVITAYRLHGAKARRVIRRIKVRGQVAALATGDLNRDGRPEYWVATWSGTKARVYALGLVPR